MKHTTDADHWIQLATAPGGEDRKQKHLYRMNTPVFYANPLQRLTFSRIQGYGFLTPCQ